MSSGPRTNPIVLTFGFISLLFTSLFLSFYVHSDDHTHSYSNNQEVTLWFNKIGPYHNPQETYQFYALPFCKPDNEKPVQKSGNGLGVQLEGDQLFDSLIDVKFRKNENKREICSMKLDAASVEAFDQAIKQHYWYQMYVDELPAWGMVGEYAMDDPLNEQSGQSYIYTHKEFSFSFNNDQLIEVNLTGSNPVPLKEGATLSFTYSVTWQPTEKSFDRRFDRYLDFDFFEHQIHWFSIFNSFMMVVFLCGLVALILMRTLKADYARFNDADEELELDKVVDESGWKQVHGDVFRCPSYLLFYSALIGTGYQLLALSVCVICVTLFATMYDERGSMTSAFLICYCMTALIAGYKSATFYKSYGGQEWKKCMLLTAGFLPGIAFSTAFLLNFIALYYDSSATYSLSTFILLIAIWLFIECPLLLVGTLIGRSTSTTGDFPCRINTLRRPIPDARWYARPVWMALFAGILPFGSIFIEMYFIFTSFWNYKVYYVYGFMFLVFVILCVVTICVTIVAVYVLLNAEDWRWHWASFACGGSTALYVFAYAIYYFFTKTKMTGVMQTAFYFGYMSLFSLGLCVLCGTIGYIGASMFVFRIYQFIKSD